MPDSTAPTTPIGPMSGPASDDLTSVLQAIEGVEGWLTADQARRLHRAASRVAPGGQVVEIGSFRGRSTIVLARGAGPTVSVVAIDPHAGNDRGPQEIAGYESEAAADHRAFTANLARAEVGERVRHLRLPSDRAHGGVDDGIDVLFVDGAHRYGPARDDLRDWGDRVVPGGRMLVHDAFSSVGVTLAILCTLSGRGRWRYVGRTGSLAEYRRTSLGPIGRLVDAARQIGELPWFARNVAVKVLIVAHLRPLTRLFGHRQPTWPY